MFIYLSFYEHTCINSKKFCFKCILRQFLKVSFNVFLFCYLGGEQKIYLQYLTRLPVMSNTECQRTLRQRLQQSFRRQFPRGVMDDLFICAAFREAGKDACGVRNIFFNCLKGYMILKVSKNPILYYFLFSSNVTRLEFFSKVLRQLESRIEKKIITKRNRCAKSYVKGKELKT